MGESVVRGDQAEKGRWELGARAEQGEEKHLERPVWHSPGGGSRGLRRRSGGGGKTAQGLLDIFEEGTGNLRAGEQGGVP